jgi:carbonic anhydrase
MILPDNPKLVSFLNKLFDTNEEFSAAHDDKFFAQFQDQQNPKLTILKCSDSRVQMESFDKTPQNDVFAIRNIGNQVITNEGSIDFGIQILKTPFLLIIGHSGCGAVEAVLSGKKTQIPAIDRELSSLNLNSTCMKEAIVENINN